MSQSRPKQTTDHPKSTARSHSKTKSVVKTGGNIQSTRNAKNLTSLNTDVSNVVTKRVGGGYSSYAYDPLDFSKGIAAANPPNTQRNQKLKVRCMPNLQKRISSEDLEEINEDTKALQLSKSQTKRVISPNRSQNSDLHRANSYITPGSFSMFQRNKSPKLNKVVHHDSCDPCTL